MKKLIIVGASGFGRELLQIVKDINKVEPTYEIKGFIDDRLNALDGFECDYEVLGTIKEWNPNSDEVFACAIADPKVKEKVVTILKEKGALFESIIHPTAIIGEFNKIGEGCVIYPYAKITVNVEIGNYFTLLGSNIGHDVKIGDWCTITGMCSINGGAKLGDGVFIGGHSVIAPQRKVGSGAYVGTGSVVVTNIRKACKVMGNPAKKVNL